MPDLSTPHFWIRVACLLVYTSFIAHIIFTPCARLQLFQIESRSPMYIQVAGTINISAYSVFLSLASFTAANLAVLIYTLSSASPQTSAQTANVYIQLLFTGLTAFVGARILNFLLDQNVTGILSGKLFSRNPLWLQGALLTSTIAVLFSPLTDISQLFLSISLALPSGETIGRIGCYFGGCCSTNLRLGSKKVPTQLVASFLNSLLGGLILWSWVRKDLDLGLEISAYISLVVNALIRIGLRPNGFAVGQLGLGLIGLAVVSSNSSIVYNLASNYPPGNMTGDNTDRRLPVPWDLSILKNKWTVVLGLASVLAGVFIQGCGSIEGAPEVDLIGLIQKEEDKVAGEALVDSGRLNSEAAVVLVTCDDT